MPSNELKRTVERLTKYNNQHMSWSLIAGRNKEMQVTMQEMRSKLEHEQAEKMDLSNELEKMEKTTCNLQQQLTSLQQELDTTNEQHQTTLQELENITKRKLEKERSILFAEVEQERGAYQKLLQNFRDMENMKDVVEEELEKLRDGKSAKEDVVQDQSRSESNQSSLSNASAADSDAAPGAEKSVSLVLKLQQRLKVVENDKAALEERIEELERESPTAEVFFYIKSIIIIHKNKLKSFKK